MKQVCRDELWLEWRIVKDQSSQGSLLSSDFRIVKNSQRNLDFKYAAVPLLALEALAEKHGWLRILRSPYHRPQDPEALVKFIKNLENMV